ncbi:MAG: ribosome-associated translation inhibitor RaiA [Candidatus Paceibacterota bacterium]|jgi:ribosomal subunit interface protein
MRIEIKTKNITLSEDIVAYAKEKLSDLDRFAQDEVREFQADLELSKPSNHHRKGPESFYAELNLQLPGKKLLRSEAYASDLRAAIDEVKEEFERELKKYKGKKLDKAKEAARESKDVRRFS